MNAKHTPGPWFQLPENNLCIESASGNVAICNLARQNDADAHLIAAAPQMLEAIRHWVGCYALDGSLQVPEDIIREYVKQAHAAIAKATQD